MFLPKSDSQVLLAGVGANHQLKKISSVEQEGRL